MKRVLISGNRGFIGRNFTRKLQDDGWTVDGFNITAADAREWFPANDDRGYDLLVHAAALVGGREVIDGDPLAIAGNMGIDQAALSWALRTTTHVLFFSSAAAYPVTLQTGNPYRLKESDLDLSAGWLGIPDNTYGWCKVSGERMVQAAREHGASVSVVRPFSGYGEDQDLAYPFPMYIDRARRRQDPFHLWSDTVRDFIHVDDLYAGCMAVVESGTTDPVNMCTGVATRMSELARMVCDVAGYDPAIKVLQDMPTGTQYRVGDPTRMHLYHQPQVSLEEGIRRALEGVT